MNRDSKTTSLWQGAHPISHLTGASLNKGDADVIIVGAGITGLTLAFWLQEQGRNCLVIEAGNPGFGTTAGTTAHLNTVLDTPYTDIIDKFGKSGAKLVAEGASLAIHRIAANIEKLGIDCGFKYLDGYLIAQDQQQAEELEKMLEAMQKVGVEADYSDTIPVPLQYKCSVRFKNQAQFNPLQYLEGIARAFANAGGTILQNTRVKSIEREGDNLNVLTENGNFTCRKAVYATHIPPGLNLLHTRCAPYRSYVMAAELEDGEAYPDALAYDMEDPYHYFRTAVIDDKKYLIVGGKDHKTGHHENASQAFTALEAYTRNLYKIKSVPYKWSAQYYEPGDGLPYIGHLPGADEHIYTATGFSGNGMILGTLSAHILCNLIVDVEDAYASLFSPSRIKPVAGFKNFVKENADVAKRFIVDRISSEQLESLSDLSKEEGKVVKYQDQKLAIYKDGTGKLCALHPVCPHAGCIVQWNNAEKSWDCPCHGARYDTTGKLLTGPATSDLKQIDIS
jgi:glycine/D-amino acid oxidase-like deaminating enzyme/nitrite reductase/ring-hydroxylating ferredoxin subunit